MSADSLELTGGHASVCCDECDNVFDIEHTKFAKPVSEYTDDGDTEHKASYVGHCTCDHEINLELEVWSCNGYSTYVELNSADECFNHLEFEIKRNY